MIRAEYLESKLDDITIAKVVDSVIGPTSVACETNHDGRSYDNMIQLEYLLYYLLDKVVDNYEYRNRHEHSAITLATQAECILKEVREIVGVLDE